MIANSYYFSFPNQTNCISFLTTTNKTKIKLKRKKREPSKEHCQKEQDENGKICINKKTNPVIPPRKLSPLSKITAKYDLPL